MEFVAVHYHEIALKGGNRPRFVRALAENLATALRGTGAQPPRRVGARLLVPTEGDPEEVLRRVERVFGVAYAMRVRRLPRSVDAVADAVVEALRAFPAPSFRISTQRDDKSFPMTSLEIDRAAGAIVHEATGTPVRLKGAALDAHVVVLADEMLLGTTKRGGPGGLPVGTGGRVVVLLSGGIDSPVAAWRMMKRGCRCDLVHFHSHPLVDRTSQEKARDLAELLTRWQYRTRLYLVPLAEVQTKVRLDTPAPLRVVLYRRFMMRIAERIAGRRGAGALVTGESLGQVASQTLHNLRTVDRVAKMPVLRPLIGMDKDEIVAQAERIGTYPISVRPDQDCCRLFLPDHPATKTFAPQAEAAEAALPVDALVRDAVAKSEKVDFLWPQA